MQFIFVSSRIIALLAAGSATRVAFRRQVCFAVTGRGHYSTSRRKMRFFLELRRPQSLRKPRKNYGPLAARRRKIAAPRAARAAASPRGGPQSVPPQAATHNLGERPMFSALFSGWRKFIIAFLPSFPPPPPQRGYYKKAGWVVQKDLSVARGGKKRENGQKSRAGVLHPLIFILLLLLTIRIKDALRSLLRMKTANFQRKGQSARISLFRDGPPSARKGYNLCKTSITPYVTDVGFLYLYFFLGFSGPSCEYKLREPAFLFAQSHDNAFFFIIG